jgi:hypothetical protein
MQMTAKQARTSRLFLGTVDPSVESIAAALARSNPQRPVKSETASPTALALT